MADETTSKSDTTQASGTGDTSSTKTGTTSATSTQATSQTGINTSGSSASSANSTNASGTSTGGTSSTATGSTLPTPQELYPQERYSVAVHPEILASKAFKDAGFLPPREFYNYNYNEDGSIEDEDPDYQWVIYKPKAGDTMFNFWKNYGVNVGRMRAWNPHSVAYNYIGETWKIRILASKLPHD